MTVSAAETCPGQASKIQIMLIQATLQLLIRPSLNMSRLLRQGRLADKSGHFQE
jgi:hypothetical protein